MEQNFISKKIRLLRSDIRGEIYREALKMEAEGKRVLKLNTGNPASFGFDTPESIRRALTERLEDATGYCDLKGMRDAREAIYFYEASKKIQNFDIEDIFLTNGVSEGVQMVTSVCLDRGDEILLPSPNYSLWENCAHLAGATPVFYRCREENGWEPDADDIRKKITKNTRAILVINPNNPTGAVYSKKVLEKIASLAREFGLILFSDEIYDRLVMDGNEALSIASLAPDLLCVTFNGISKSHVVCGHRCGWAVLSGPEALRAPMREGMTRLASMRLCANALAQLAVPAALADSAYTKEMLRPGGRIFEQRKVTTDALSKIDGISFVKNSAAFYLFPRLDEEKFSIADDRAFALELLRAKRILIVPASGFAYGGNHHFRIVMLPEASVLKKAVEELGDFLSDLPTKAP